MSNSCWSTGVGGLPWDFHSRNQLLEKDGCFFACWHHFDQRPCDFYGKSTCVSGALHWSFTFDLEDENFRSIQVPDGISTEDGSVHIFRYLSGWNAITFKKLIQVNSYLALIDYKDLLIHNEMKLWILKDCQNQKWIEEITYLWWQLDTITKAISCSFYSYWWNSVGTIVGTEWNFLGPLLRYEKENFQGSWG